MKEFSSVVSVCLLSDYIQNSSHVSATLYADSFDLQPTLSESEAGILFDCSKELYVDLPDKSVMDMFASPKKSIVTLKTIDGTDVIPIILGSKYVPARVSIQPYLNKAKLIISCKMLKSPI